VIGEGESSLGALGILEQAELVDRPIGIGDDRLEQAQEMVRHLLDRLGVEQVSAVLEHGVEAVLLLLQEQRQVDAGGCLRGLELLGLERRERDLRIRWVERQQRLDDRVAGEVALRRQRPPPTARTAALMLDRVERPPPHRAEQLPEARASLTGRWRSTIVFTNGPISCSSSARLRVSTGAPMTTSV